MHKHIDEIEFTIFDTETTGLDPESGDRVVEVAAIRFKGNDRIAEFQTLVNPQRPISRAAFQVNHISQDMLARAPAIEKVMPDFLNFIKDSCLCSYNAGFDLGFINNELKILGRAPLEDVVVVDILKMSRRLLPGLERYALWFIAGYLGFKNKQEHRALSDVELTLGVFRKLKEILDKKGIVDSLNFTHLFSISPKIVESIRNQRIAEIQEAINLGVKLKIKYISSSGQISEREVVPEGIKQDNKQIYLIAHCCLRDEKRNFRLDGILHLQIL